MKTNNACNKTLKAAYFCIKIIKPKKTLSLTKDKHLKILKSIPAGLLDLEADQLHELLGGPTLIHLTGRIEQPLFVSVLQHGNEPTGWDAIRVVLKKLQHQLPRSLILLIGNVNAARFKKRKLDHQPDFNRCWNNGGIFNHPFEQVTQEVLDYATHHKPYASIDLHNNTGFNPHYAALNRKDQQFYQLATLFSRTVVYFEIPNSVQSSAFANICPSVTLECGQVGENAALNHAIDYLDSCLHLHHLPVKTVAPHDMDLFHTLATIKIPEDVSFGFKKPEHDIRFVEDLDHLNFQELKSQTLLGYYNEIAHGKLLAIDEHGNDISDQTFSYTNGEIRLTRAFMPAMLTLDHHIIRQDCLCYLMERMEF